MAGERVLASRAEAMLHGQVEALLPMMDAVMREAGLGAAALDLLAVTTGPGSFTGIRVGLAAARGIALAAGLPMIGVTSFAATAAAARPAALDRAMLTALDSRRADLYLQLFDRGGRLLCAPAALAPALLPAMVETALGAQPLTIAGDAAPRAAAALGARRATIVLEPVLPLALGAAAAALARWRQGERGGQPQPLYLRPPGVTLAPRPESTGR
jgi:tRNA threonylcarbamoyladenosine biosynthesis protein TsaB